MITRRGFIKLGAASGAATYLATHSSFVEKAFGQVGQLPPLPGNQIPQFVDPLPLLSVQGGSIETLASGTQTITMQEFKANMLPLGAVPAYTGTWVWGYRKDPPQQPADTYIGPVFVVPRNTASNIKWVNNLPQGLPPLPNVPFWWASTDQTLHWADPKMQMGSLLNFDGPVPAVVHLHGGEVPPQLDGGPDAWYLSTTQPQQDVMQSGHGYYTSLVAGDAAQPNEAIFRYPNTQEAANIWFHDHALGITRLNVYAGLAGGYIIYDSVNAPPVDLGGVEGAAKIIPLVLQDRMFDITGQLFFPNVGLNPEHPFWVPEFVGDVICVNGKSWPYLTVNQKRYRFLFLDGSNARFYDMFLIDPVTGVKGPPMYVIGTDGGYLNGAVKIDPNATGTQTKAGTAKSLVMGPGERYDVLIDFGDATWLTAIGNAYAALGQPVPDPLRLHLRNTAKTPFPGGAPAAAGTTGRVMEFRVSPTATGTPPDATFNPALAPTPNLRPTNAIVNITGAIPQVKRQLTLNEIMGRGGPLEILENNTKWSGESLRSTVGLNDFTAVQNPDGSTTHYSEMPNEGAIEQWEIINLTADAHPIHLHLVQFQLMNRQAFDVAGYTAAYNAAFPGIAGDPVGGMFLPAFGPPKNYNLPNADNAVGGNPAISPFLNAKKWPAVPPLPQEAGWKDTVIMYPGQVTRIMVRWAPTHVAAGDTANEHFPFDPNAGHGYVWHCHIIDHEDNEMMRPDLVIAKDVPRTFVKGTDY